jgi:hypothetical protein
MYAQHASFFRIMYSCRDEHGFAGLIAADNHVGDMYLGSCGGWFTCLYWKMKKF